MNAKQSKLLIVASQQALALLDPNWQAYRQLQQALADALTTPTAKREKAPYHGTHCALCYQALNAKPWPSCFGDGGSAVAWNYKPIRFDKFPNGVRTRVLADAVHESCNEWMIARKDWTWANQTRHVPTRKFDAKAMEYCACGHHADNHAKDEMENLLQCSGTDYKSATYGAPCPCDHFHYQLDDSADESVEPTGYNADDLNYDDGGDGNGVDEDGMADDSAA